MALEKKKLQVLVNSYNGKVAEGSLPLDLQEIENGHFPWEGELLAEGVFHIVHQTDLHELCRCAVFLAF